MHFRQNDKLLEFLINLSQLFIINDSYVDVILVTRAVPLGKILAPMLISVHIDDLFEFDLSSNIRCFADDVKLLGASLYNRHRQCDVTLLWN